MTTSKHFTVILNVLIFLSLTAHTLSQKLEDIETDRPDQTESAGIVPPLYLQIEVGGSVETEKYSYTLLTNPPVSKTYKVYERSLPSLLLRYGVLKILNLGLQ